MNENNQSQRIPSFRSFLWASILLMLFGWGGLAFLVSTAFPDLESRWMFYFLWLIGITGMAIPVTYFLNRRFISIPPASGGIVVRQALWFGIYGSLIAWLQQGRVLTGVLAIILAVGFALVELLLRVRELSLWKPKGPANG